MSSRELLHLRSPGASVVLECATDEAPLWRYWGPELHIGGDANTSAMLHLRDSRSTPPASLEHDLPLSIAPCFGMGWFGQSALLAHRHGQDFAQEWTQATWSQPSAHSAQIELLDTCAQVAITIELALCAQTGVLSVRTVLRNVGDADLDVQWLAAACLPLPAPMAQVRSYGGLWANEFACDTQVPGRSIWHQENRRGRTSHAAFAGALVLADGATQDLGLVYAAHLAWSGNHSQSIERLADGRCQWQLGVWLAPGELRLAPGAHTTSPTVYAACGTDGAGGVMRRFHACLRQVMPRSSAPRQVHLNTWEAKYFDHDEADLKLLADAAADMGVERFVLDDGWFLGRNNDRAGLGDWIADPRKYPQGLRPLANHVIACGMSFGLWVEPEMVNPDSDLYRAHPDWVLGLAGRPLRTARNQLVLNLSKPEVSQAMFEQFNALLTELPISYLKWDMNRDLAPAGSNGHASYHAQAQAVDALMARVRQGHPLVDIENCASGGGRADFAMMAQCSRLWLSDCNDAVARLSIQRHAMQWFAPEVLGSHVGSAPAHTTGRSQSMAFRAAVALGHHFGMELDVRRLSADDAGVLRNWVALYRSIRLELAQGETWLGDLGDHIVWQAHGTAASLLVLIYRTEPSQFNWSPALCLPMLHAQAHYRVERINPQPTATHTAAQAEAPYFQTWHSEDAAPVPGDWLRQVGLPLPRMLAETAIVLRISAQA